MILLLILFAVAIGAASTKQSVGNGVLSARLGLATTVLINGVIVCSGALVWWLVATRDAVSAAPPSPWYLYLGGVYGLAVAAGAMLLLVGALLVLWPKLTPAAR